LATACGSPGPLTSSALAPAAFIGSGCAARCHGDRTGVPRTIQPGPESKKGRLRRVDSGASAKPSSLMAAPRPKLVGDMFLYGSCSVGVLAKLADTGGRDCSSSDCTGIGYPESSVKPGFCELEGSCKGTKPRIALSITLVKLVFIPIHGSLMRLSISFRHLTAISRNSGKSAAK